MTGDTSPACGRDLQVGGDSGVTVELRFRRGYPESDLARAEIEALQPYLCDLAADLVSTISMDADED